MARRGRRVTAEERALWDQVARTTSRKAAAPAAPQDPVEPASTLLPAPAPPAPVSLRPIGRPEPSVTLPTPPREAPNLGLDRRTAERLRKGKRDPDARIDLHGMTADRAHRALGAFIFDARARGCRMVLVITGKGAASAPRAFGDPAPGVLRREAPVWLRTPPLSAHVVSVSQAHVRHGGGGALYVYLRKMR